ncbi:MAG: DUF302 domain-containing protein [Actinomycetota bacterium]
MEHAFAIDTAMSYEDAVPKVKEALKAQGFGILTEIDISATMKEKLGEEVEPYVILGACNPSLAYRALEADRQIGLLLPCTVVVRARGGGIRIEALDPNIMATFAGESDLKSVASEASERIRAALDSLAS